MPDAIGFLRAGSGAYLITANEGDSRDYDAFSEEDRIKMLYWILLPFRIMPAFRTMTVSGG